jgi:hypothetical protein
VSRLPVESLKTTTNELDLGDAKTFHLPDWANLSHPQRLAVMRQISMMRGRDPRIAKLAVSILRRAGVGPRQYDQQAAAILKWVQDPRNVYYVNEPGERLQDPLHTIKVGHGDCDDQVILLAAIYESIGLPWKFVLSGRNSVGEKLRYIEGDPLPEARWAHIYLAVGVPPFNPIRWYFAETTIVGVPLGWDVIDGDSSYLPEMGSAGQTPRFLKPEAAPAGYRPPPLPPEGKRSPAYDQILADALGELDSALGNAPLDFSRNTLVGSSVGTYLADEMLESEAPKGTSKWKEWGTAIATGVLVSVGTTLVLNFINGQGLWQGKGTLLHRWKKG